MSLRIMGFALAILLPAADPPADNKLVVLARPGVELQLNPGESVLPRTAGLAQDITFRVLQEAGDRLQVESRRQRGWIARTDAVPFDKAVVHFTEQLARNPKDADALTARGEVLASSNEADKAVADFNEAIKLNPRAKVAYYHRANVEYGRKQYDQALEDYNAVIRLDPEFDWAYHVRGWIYYRKKDYDKALADYETAIKLVPSESVFRRDRGNVELVRKQYDLALADYTKATELEPTYAVPWMQRGKTYTAMKDYGNALADYEKAVQLTAKSSVAAPYLTALALFRAGCPDAQYRDGAKALVMAQKAYELQKGPAEMAALAAAHAELGQFDHAVEWQTKVVAAVTAEEKDAARERLKKYQEKMPFRME